MNESFTGTKVARRRLAAVGEVWVVGLVVGRVVGRGALCGLVVGSVVVDMDTGPL